MRDPETFKFDVRVRERMMKSGRLSSEELTKHLEAVEDVESNLADIELDQPALGRPDGSAAPKASAIPPTVSTTVSTADREVENPQGAIP